MYNHPEYATKSPFYIINKADSEEGGYQISMDSHIAKIIISIKLFEINLKIMPLYRKLIEDFNKIINELERNNKDLLTKVEIANNTRLGSTSIINKIKFLNLYGFI